MNKSALIFAMLALSVSGASFGLSLDEYLQQVRSKNEGYKSEAMKAAAAEERADEWKTMYMPTLVADALYDSNGKPTNVPAFQGNKTVFQRASLGVQQLTNFGMTARLTQSVEQTEIFGSGGLLPLPKWTDVYPQLELTQSLWKNGFGSETRAQVDQKEAGALSAKYAESFKVKQRLSQAETTYWKLALNKKLLEISKSSLERAESVLEWANRRAKLDLADRADRLAAEAGQKVRVAELRGTEQDLKMAAREFNSVRGVESEQVEDVLEELSVDKILSLTVPKRADFRDDVKQAAADKKVNEARSQLAIEQNSPTLDLTGKFNLTGRDLSAGEALRESLGTQHPSYQVGLKLTMPLDLARQSDTRGAYADEKKAAELAYARKLMETDIEWKGLATKFEDMKARYKLMVDLEKAQKEKTDYEQERLKKGRTTTFVAVQYEQEYLQSRVQRARLEVELLGVVAQMKTFGESYESR